MNFYATVGASAVESRTYHPVSSAPLRGITPPSKVRFETLFTSMSSVEASPLAAMSRPISSWCLAVTLAEREAFAIDTIENTVVGSFIPGTVTVASVRLLATVKAHPSKIKRGPGKTGASKVLAGPHHNCASSQSLREFPGAGSKNHFRGVGFDRADQRRMKLIPERRSGQLLCCRSIIALNPRT